jgi:hypothetical protein
MKLKTLLLTILIAAALALYACSYRNLASRTPAPFVRATPGLPFGGNRILPGHRVVAFYGAAQTPDMGILGSASPQRVASELMKQARAYDRYDEPVVPAFELIATVAQSDPGADGDYNGWTDAQTINRYLRAVRAIHGLLILDIQPGRAPFLREIRRYDAFLRQPDVSLALDSEWSMRAEQVPAQVIGGTTGDVVNQVSAYLGRIVARDHLPQKMLIVHQFTPDMIERRSAIVQRTGIAIVFHVDGFGTRAGKVSKYRLLSQNRGRAFMGFKLFYRQDIDMFSAAEVMRLRPPPDLITYE